MNYSQKLWWQQAKSDHDVFALVRGQGMAACHSLHYLQMATEKIAKAYFWRSGSPPPRSHAGFVQFLRFLGQVRQHDREHIADLFAFARFVDFQNWIRAVLPIAYDLERLTPELANDGPNPEYPWPHAQPHTAPAGYEFPVWGSLKKAQGRELMRVIRIAIEYFPAYADL
jgi:hypothetical protein